MGNICKVPDEIKYISVHKRLDNLEMFSDSFYEGDFQGVTSIINCQFASMRPRMFRKKESNVKIVMLYMHANIKAKLIHVVT